MSNLTKTTANLNNGNVSFQTNMSKTAANQKWQPISFSKFSKLTKTSANQQNGNPHIISKLTQATANLKNHGNPHHILKADKNKSKPKKPTPHHFQADKNNSRPMQGDWVNPLVQSTLVLYSTVAILAQGTHWAVAEMQAFCASAVQYVTTTSSGQVDMCGMSEVAQWLACWAHNPKVPGSKPGFATCKCPMDCLLQVIQICSSCYSICYP